MATSNFPLNMMAIECRDLEKLADDWEYQSYDCPQCGHEGAIQLHVHYAEDGTTDTIETVSKNCPGCGIPFLTDVVEV